MENGIPAINPIPAEVVEKMRNFAGSMGTLVTEWYSIGSDFECDNEIVESPEGVSMLTVPHKGKRVCMYIMAKGVALGKIYPTLV